MTPPLQLGAEEDFRLVREFLEACGYTERGACHRLGIERLDHVDRVDLCDFAKRDANLGLRDALSTVVKLFLQGQMLDSAEVSALLPAPVLGALQDLDLVRHSGRGCFSPVRLYPVVGLYLASDRYTNPDGSQGGEFSDFVCLVIQRSGMDYLAFQPDTPCETFLELASGCGVAALWAARNFAQHAWAVDITERSVHFAEFNRRLNGIANATILKGDLYEPVKDLQFDRIALHPPYVIGSTPGMIYTDGGEDGESLTRQAIAQLHGHLNPGGIFACWAMATDRSNAPFEQRVRQMLGSAQDDCDVAVLVDATTETEEYALDTIALAKGKLQDIAQWRERFARLGIERLLYGGILIQRHAAPGIPPFTARRVRRSGSGRRAIDWLVSWEGAKLRPEFRPMLLDARPAASSRAELQVRHQFRGGELQPVEYTLRTEHPFAATLNCKAWLAYLFSRVNGQRTGAELFAEIAPKLPAGAGRDHFLDALTVLADGGFIELEGFRPPEEG